VDANFAIGPPIDWQVELDQGVTDVYVDANFTIRPINWQLELDQDITDLVHGCQLCHQTNRLAN